MKSIVVDRGSARGVKRATIFPGIFEIEVYNFRFVDARISHLKHPEIQIFLERL